MKDVMELIENLRFSAYGEGVANTLGEQDLALSATEQCRTITDLIRQRLNMIAQQNRRIKQQTFVKIHNMPYDAVFNPLGEEEEEQPPIVIEFSL